MSHERKYSMLFDEMPCFVSVQDRDMRIEECNRIFRESFGAKNGAFCYEVYKGRMSKCEVCPVEKTFRTGKSQQGEELVKTIDGKEIPVYVFTSPVFDEKGYVKSVLEISSDISEVKRIQKRLYNTQKQMQQFFDEVPCYITIQDEELKIKAANRKFREDFGNGIGRYCYDIYKHRTEPCLECPVADTFEDGQQHQSEEVVTAISGEQYNVLVSTAPLFTSSGRITNVMEMSTNITQIRQLQDQLTSLGLLVGSISHGIKGLAAGLDGGLYLMSTGLAKNNNERIEKGWDIVERNVSRIRNMVLDILYYAKDREMEYESVDANEYLTELASLLEEKASKLNITYAYEFQEEMGSWRIDPIALRSALVNILENSLDACRKDIGQEEHRVEIKGKRDEKNGTVVIDIQDNGIGMDRETQEKIFSLFFSSKGVEGTGLGLFISNKIVSKHGGDIKVNSSLGEGASFSVRIPIKSIDTNQIH